MVMKMFYVPDRTIVLSGAWHIQFEVVLHGVTSWIEVGWLVGIPATNEMTKNALCQSAADVGLVSYKFRPAREGIS